MGRFRRSTSMALFAISALLTVSAGPTAAAAPLTAAVTPDLDGRAIAVGEIAAWHCHDLDFPRIHCFRSEADLARAIATRTGKPQTDAAGVAAVTAYVIAYRDATYGGPSIAISQNYDDLRVIGWNDTISSFKAVNGLRGHFATDAFNGGRSFAFCCNVTVPDVGDASNDQFSSVYGW